MSETTRPAGNPGCALCSGSGLSPDLSLGAAPDATVQCRNCLVPFDGAVSRLDWQRIYDQGFNDGLKSPCRPKGRTGRLPRRHLRAWPGRDGNAEISVDPLNGDGVTTPSDAMWEVPAEEIGEVIAVLSTVVDPGALDLKTQRDALAHELENARRALADAEARAYSQGVEDMREKAARTVRAYSDDLDELAGEIHALPLASVTERHPLTAFHNAPAPRDSHMTSEVRSLVKRYGAPAIAAEAARQAKEER